VFSTGPRVCLPTELDVRDRVLVGDGAVRYRAVFEENGGRIPPDDDPAHVPDPLLLVARAGSFGAADQVLPLYVREPDARPRS
jgi:tRNA A37 threonylcarbamoyladenosine modification protein TsaB